MTFGIGAALGPAERRRAAAAFLTLFGLLAAHALLETARDALFLARLPASQLPWTYLAIAATAAAVSQLPWPSRRTWLGQRPLSVVLLATAAVTAGMWALGPAGNAWKLHALYVWTGVNATVTGLQLWLILAELWSFRQAKRVFPAITIGGLLGGVAGGALARLITSAATPSALVLASAVVQALTALGPALLLPATDSAFTRPRRPLASSMRLVRDHPYARGLASLAVLSTMALTAADFVFKSGVARAIPANEFAAFFSTFYAVVNALALGTQLFVARWILRALGMPRAQAVLPGLLLVGSAGVVAGGALAAVVLLKAADGTFRDLHRTASELFLVPISHDLRSRTKPFLDVVARRGGQAAASLGILAMMSLPRAETWVAGACAAFSLAWILRAQALREPYLDLFRAALREGRLHEQGDLFTVDVASLEALFAALGSGDDTEVIAAMDVLADQGRIRLVPSVVLYHPSEAVALHALELFERSGRRDFVAAADRLLGHASPRIRAAALRAQIAATRDPGVLRAAAGDPSPSVRATAYIALVSMGESSKAMTLLKELIEARDPEACRELARAIAQRPSPAFEGVVARLAHASEPAVLVEVARAMGALRSERFLPVLLDLLTRHEVRAAAREALVGFGERGLSFVAAALADQSLPHDVRFHVPRTINRFPAKAAAPVLLGRLLDEPDGMVRYKILRALGRIVAEDPRLPLDREILRRAIDGTLEVAFRLVHWRLVLLDGGSEDRRRATSCHEILVQMLCEKQSHAIERLFRLLALSMPGESFEDIHRGLASSSPKLRASSLELLEQLLTPALREPILALVDETPDHARLARGGVHYRPGALDYPGLLAVLLKAPGDTLRSLAVHHIGELRLRDLRDRVERLHTENPTGLLGRATARALRRLSDEGRELVDAR
jgi:AAA family ATP:ADP antiporter